MSIDPSNTKPQYSIKPDRRIKWPWLFLIIMVATVYFGALPAAFAVRRQTSTAAQPHAPVAQGTIEALEKLNAEELTLLTELFETSSRIDQLETEKNVIQGEIEVLGLQIEDKQAHIDEQAFAYQTIKGTLGEILKSQQRAGAASNLEIILSAKSLKDLLRRLNLLRELSRKTDTMMQETQTARLNLEVEKAALSELFEAQKLKEIEMTETLRSMTEAQAALESQLQAIADDREFYETTLNRLDQDWAAFKPVFTKAVTALSEMLETGDVPAGTFDLEFTLLQAKGRITEDKFNAAVKLRQDLPELLFDFSQNGVLMSFVKEKAELQGRFELVDQKVLNFKIESGTFQGVPIGRAALEDLVSRGTLTFDLSATLGRSTLRQITHEDGAIVLTINIILF